MYGFFWLVFHQSPSAQQYIGYSKTLLSHDLFPFPSQLNVKPVMLYPVFIITWSRFSVSFR